MLRVLYRRLNVNTTLAWTVVLFALPIAGAVLYLLFGNYRSNGHRRRRNHEILSYYQAAFDLSASAVPEVDGMPDRFLALANSVHQQTGFPVQSGNAYSILTDPGDTLAKMRTDIDQSRSTCSIEFYIIDPRGRVEAVLEAIERAAQRGVVCRILADDFGSSVFFRSEWPQRLRTAGVTIVRSLPVNLMRSFSKRTDQRNHRKLLICDQETVYVGSFNLIDPTLFKTSSHVGQWIDTMLRIEGPIVDALACQFNTDFLLDTHPLHIPVDPLQALPYECPQRAPKATETAMQVLPSGPEMRQSYIYDFIVSAIYNAQSRVRIITPYFIPDQAILLALKSAATRGVSVEIIVPEKVDTWLGQYASQAAYDELLSAGITIQRYQKGLLHTKTILVDFQVCLFGTANLDTRSLYLNLEISLLLYGERVNAELDALADQYIANSRLLTADAWSQRSAGTRFLENVLRLAAPLL